MDYKYLKYKLKYLNIKKSRNIYGGSLEDNIIRLESYNSEFMYTTIPEVYYSIHPIYRNLYMICEKLVDSSEFGINGLARDYIETKLGIDSIEISKEDSKRFDFNIRWFNYKYFCNASNNISQMTLSNEYNVYISYIVDLEDYRGDELSKIKSWIEEPIVNIKKLIIQKYLWIRKLESKIPVAIHFFIRNRNEIEKLHPKWGIDEIHDGKLKYPHQSIILHGFSACILKKFFTHIKFVWSSPSEIMYNILKKTKDILDEDILDEDILHDKTLSSIDIYDIKYKLSLVGGRDILISLDNLIKIANAFIANILKEKETTVKEMTTKEEITTKEITTKEITDIEAKID